MPHAVAVVMDPIGSIKISKDTTFALLLEAQRRGHRLFYATQGDLAVADGRARARLAPLRVHDEPGAWFALEPAQWRPLADMDVVLMRKDPPADAQYFYDTMVLSLAQAEGTLVLNDPQGLRDMNEKLFALHFPQCCPPSLLCRDVGELRGFIEQHRDCVLKPLDGMGGRSIFRARLGDDNLKVILETLSDGGRQLVLAQRFLPEIRDGDKRILLIDGEPVPYALARIPAGDDFRGNLAVGGRGVGRELNDRDRWICAQVGPELARRGMLFVGLDVIGEWLTEINVTSPTCLRELDALYGLNIAGQLFDRIEARLPAR